MVYSKTIILFSLLALGLAVPKPPKKYNPSIHGEKRKFKLAQKEKLLKTKQPEDSYSSFVDEPMDYFNPIDLPSDLLLPIHSYSSFDGEAYTDPMSPPPAKEDSSYSSYVPRRLPLPEVIEALRKMVRTQAAASSYVKYNPQDKEDKVAAPSSYITYTTATDTDALEVPGSS